jgi:hypothetical protein
VTLIAIDKRLGGQFGTITDFWAWAFGDLRSNNVRGVFAEWMVAQLLGLQPGPRGSREEYDLMLPTGLTIEVKASAYLQVWHSPDTRPSVIQFTGLKGDKWIDESQRRNSPEKTYNADLYVFCVQTERDPERWDAFDLSQWDFYVVPPAKIERHGSNSLRLSVVQGFSSKLTANELRAAVAREEQAHTGRADSCSPGSG